MTAKKPKSITEQRCSALRIPETKWYKDHGNHWCVHVALSERELEVWKKDMQKTHFDRAWSVHIENFERKQVPGGHAYAIYIHG